MGLFSGIAAGIWLIFWACGLFLGIGIGLVLLAVLVIFIGGIWDAIESRSNKSW